MTKAATGRRHSTFRQPGRAAPTPRFGIDASERAAHLHWHGPSVRTRDDRMRGLCEASWAAIDRARAWDVSWLATAPFKALTSA